MPFPFAAVCDLLEQSYDLCQSSRRGNAAAAAVVHAWFRRHRSAVDAHDTDRTALLSTLLPEKRTDRVYAIQAATLERMVGRALALGASRMLELATYKRPGAGVDLAECVERILSVTPNPVQGDHDHQVTVEEVDALLHGLAARVRWSAPAIRQPAACLSHQSRGDLEALYRRLSPRDAKWFTRLILKDYRPLLLDAPLLYRACDPVLPCILQIRDDFTEALAVLSAARGPLLATTPALSARRVLATVKPKLGVKVGRQQWLKGRSIKHCMDIGGGRMSVERKMDGEYCQIHVDLGRPRTERVQIFSKSGKDSTEDREKVIPAIERALRLDTSECGFQKACILEGELLVYNDLENKIMPFHKNRGHVTRRGLHLGTEQDSQPKPHEHLMIVYYDVFLLDDQSLMDARHSARFQLLERIIRCEPGVAALVPRETIDFRHSLAASTLRKAFAKIITSRGEGLVLKPEDEPYVVVDERGRAAPCRCIKLKKEYIGAFGDVGDFALVGAGFDAAATKTYPGIPHLQWTHFYLGCLTNKEEVRRWGRRPAFTVVCAVALSEALLRSFLALGGARTAAVPHTENTATKLTVPAGVQCPAALTVAFADPAVADLRCFGFDRPGNADGLWTPRFPAVTKIHADRDWADVVTLDELQSMAAEAAERPPEREDSQENLRWIARLEGADPHGIAVDAVSQATATTAPTPSPAGTTRSTAAGLDSQSSGAATESSRQGLSVASTPAVNEGGARRDSSVSVVSVATSSSANGLSTQRTAVHAPAKRVPESASPEQGFKRPRTGSIRSKAAAAPPRMPLRSMDVNTSYGGDSQSADSQDSQATVKLGPRRPPAAAARDDVIVIPSSDAEDNSQDRRRSQASASSTPFPSPHKTDNHLLCKHVGRNCSLLNKTLLLSSPALLLIAELTTLIRDHGVPAPPVIPCAETWRPPRPHYMLLVDSMKQGAETRALITRLNAARPREEGDNWIAVYDWRVLRHVSIAEDARIAKKYYDGFQDPWRRWYCGLV